MPYSFAVKLIIKHMDERNIAPIYLQGVNIESSNEMEKIDIRPSFLMSVFAVLFYSIKERNVMKQENNWNAAAMVGALLVNVAIKDITCIMPLLERMQQSIVDVSKLYKPSDVIRDNGIRGKPQKDVLSLDDVIKEYNFTKECKKRRWRANHPDFPCHQPSGKNGKIIVYRNELENYLNKDLHNGT